MDRDPLFYVGMSFTPSTYARARSPRFYALGPRRETLEAALIQ